MSQRLEFCERHLGTPVRLVLTSGSDLEHLAAESFAECARIEAAYSRFIADNELAALNARVGEWAEVSAELYALIVWGETMKKSTEGAFDLSVKSILDGWGYDAQYSFIEGSAGRRGPLELGEGRVKLSAPIELGGLGKGYAIDRVGEILRRGGCEDFLVDAGGDLLLSGCDELDAPWRVAFEHPTDLSQAIGLLEGSNLALACSSPSRRSWKNAAGQRHHLVDPRSGEPATQMLAVYTQAPTALVADSYSTALFVLGFEKARELLGDLPVEAMLVGPGGEIFRTASFQGTLFTE